MTYFQEENTPCEKYLAKKGKTGYNSATICNEVTL